MGSATAWQSRANSPSTKPRAAPFKILKRSLKALLNLNTMDEIPSNHRFDPVGKCIYCSSNDELSDEHILALALGGHWILPAASCLACASITGRDEALVLRGGLWAVRDFLKFPSRSKKRPTHFPLHAVNGNESRKILVASEHYPVLLALPLYAGPNLLPLPDCPRLIGEPWFKFLRVDPDILEKTYGATEYAPSSMDAHAFARLLMKVAHGLAVATYGAENFRPFLPPYILGKKKDYLTLVGSSNESSICEHDHELKIADFGNKPVRWIVAHLNLFAKFGAPGFRVIVGQHLDGLQVALPDVHVNATSQEYASHLRMLIRFSETQDPGWDALSRDGRN